MRHLNLLVPHHHRARPSKMGLMTVDDKSGGKFLWTDPALMVHTQRRPQREVEEQEPPLASHP